MSADGGNGILAPFEPATMPLTGVRLVEASAGTGKTFSLAGLYLRLIVEERLDVREILVMTFTRAATQELRERLRTRLARAARIAADPGLAAAGDAADAFIEGVIEGRAEPRPDIAERLRRAATHIDEATITTIHGFAQRAAAENAFASALPFDRGEPADDIEIAREASADYWRSRVFATDGHEGRAFLNLWPDPDRLWQDVRKLVNKTHARLLRPDERRVAADVRAARKQWDREAFCKLLAEALEYNALYKNCDLRKQLDALGPEGLAEQIEMGLAGTRDGYPIVPAVLAGLADEEQAVTHVQQKARAWCHLDALPAVAELARLAINGRALARVAAVEEIRTRCRERKRERRLFSFADMIEQLHAAITDPQGGPGLAAALRTTWPWALVDESQDTDPLQYTILQRIYRPEATAEATERVTAAAPAEGEHGDDAAGAPRGGLILVGDPKQAIYAFRGGDVFTFLAAARDADGRYGMTTNFRSTPAVVAGLNALFHAGGEAAFVLDGIAFQPVEAARSADDRRITLGDETIGGVTAWHVPTDESNEKGAGQARIRTATVERIAALLRGGQVEKPGESRPVRPGDIAVLVNSNREAAAMQHALARAGVPAICIQQDSVFTREAALDLLRLLQAAAAPLDGERLRVALLTPLFGLRLGNLLALDADEAAWADWTDRFQQLHADWLQRGIQAMLEPVLQAAAARVGAREDGERRLTDYLHLADRLQEAERETFGPDGLVGWLATAIDEADAEGDAGDADRLRLADEGELVQVTTVHKAKGLQFPIVFVPYAPWIGTSEFPKRPDQPPLDLHGADNQALIDPGLPDSDTRTTQALRERRAEQMRSLYVALTRAEEACVFTHCAAKAVANGPLAWLLHQDAGATLETWLGGRAKPPDWLTDERVQQDLYAVADASDGHLQALALPASDDGVTPPKRDDAAKLGRARTDLPAPRAHWGIFSFSGLAGRMSAAAEPAAGADDPAEADARAFDDADTTPGTIPLTPRGPGFGQALHDLLEAGDFARWPRPGEAADDDTITHVTTALRRHGVAAGDGPDGSIARTVTMLGATVHAELPEIGPLAAIPRARRRAEMEFFLRLGGAEIEDVLSCIAAAGHAGARAPSAPARLRGLMHGYIDLIVEHGGRYWLLDYKTNALGARPAHYAPDNLARAMREHHYDLQYLIYSVALHRHLRQHLADYAPEQHLGGVLYLFVRGLDGGPDTGVFRDHPDPTLIATLDARLDATGASA